MAHLRRLLLAVLLALPWSAASTAKQPRIAVLTLSPGVLAQPYMAQTAVNKAKYANQHDYGFHLFDQLDDSRVFYWSKLLALKKIIKSREYDWLLWLDGSVVITNHRIRIESMLPRNLTIDFVVTRDCHSFTLGAFLVRASRTALDLLEVLYDGPEVNSTVVSDPGLDSKSFQILYSKSKPLRERTLEVPQKTFNSYTPQEAGKCGKAGWSEADFAIHLSGGNDRMRETLVPHYLKNVIA